MFRLLAVLTMAGVSVNAQTIVGLGVLTGSTSSYAYGVSGDGSTVVGVSGSMAFRWTSASGIQDIGKLAGASLAGAYAANYDGSIIVGDSTASGSRAFKWSQSSGMQALDLPSSGVWQNTMAFGISSNGLSVSGYGNISMGSFYSLKWGAPNFSPSVGQQSSLSWGTSGNGQFTVGTLNNRIYRWEVLGGAQDLGDGYARGTNYDGSVVVGSSGASAFRWNETGGVQLIGSGEAISTSADGSIVVGHAGSSAFAWTTNSGRKDLSQYLSEFGVDVSGWSLEKAEGISYDGSTIVGQGVFNGTRQAFVAMVPEPTSFSLILATGTLLLLIRKRIKNNIKTI